MIKKENKYLIYDKPKNVNGILFLKNVLNFIHNIVYKFLYVVDNPCRSGKTKYNVSICAIFRDEADYLKEWIEFHRVVGVEHFYLYNNFSVDNYESVLRPYIESGIVTLKDWPIKQGQMSAYADFFEKYASETKWVGLLDLDEFVVPNSYNTIYDFLQKFENRPAVILYWKVFGAAGKIDRDITGLVTEDFVIGYKKYVDIGKLFFNTKYKYFPEYEHNNAMHLMWAKGKKFKLPPVNIFDKVCSFSCNPVVNDEMPIQINHYLIKSYREYLDKKSKRGGGVHDVGMHDMGYFFRNEMMCQHPDYSTYKYLVKLKLQLEK